MEEEGELRMEVEEDEGGDVMYGGEVEKKREVSKDERGLMRLGDPRLPSEAEVEDHYKTHLPYRNWCPHCVRARGKDRDHRKSVDQERGLNEFSFDFGFPGDESGNKITVLVGKERGDGMLMATAAPTKRSRTATTQKQQRLQARRRCRKVACLR